MAKEPILFLVIGGVGLIQAVIHTLRAFGVGISEAEETALITLASIIIGILQRMLVYPASAVSPKAAAIIAADKVAHAKS